MAKSWQFRAGMRAGFGHEEYKDELYRAYPAYQAGYAYAVKKLTESKQDKHMQSIRKEP